MNGRDFWTFWGDKGQCTEIDTPNRHVARPLLAFTYKGKCFNGNCLKFLIKKVQIGRNC